MNPPLSYSTFIPDPPKFITHGIKPCPTHGHRNISTTNDGNKKQTCMICNWTYQHPTH
jgi:hypothetical protein